MANALNKIYKDYIDFYFESSCSTTPEFASFARKIKNALKKDAEAAGLKLVEFSRGHFYISDIQRFSRCLNCTIFQGGFQELFEKSPSK